MEGEPKDIIDILKCRDIRVVVNGGEVSALVYGVFYAWRRVAAKRGPMVIATTQQLDVLMNGGDIDIGALFGISDEDEP